MDAHEFLMMQHREEDDDDDHHVSFRPSFASGDYGSTQATPNGPSGSNVPVLGGIGLNTTAEDSFMHLVRSHVRKGPTNPSTSQLQSLANDSSRTSTAERAAKGTAAESRNRPNDGSHLLEVAASISAESNANDAMTFKRFNDMRIAANRDKQTLLKRIEELSDTLRQVQDQLAEKDQVVRRYHDMFGPLHEFSNQQVRLREEIVSLHDTVRLWQEKESAAREQIRLLEKSIANLTKKGDCDSAESRLDDLQQRLAHAHLQKNEILAEVAAVENLVQQQERHAGDFPNPVLDLNMQAQWRQRGKLAELHVAIKSKTELIASLEKAVAEVQKIVVSESASKIGQGTRKCAGCGKPQWTSPYCAKTGHKHLGFEDDPVEAELQSGRWKKLVHAGTCEVSYKNVTTGQIVSDLGAELARQRQVASPAGNLPAANVQPSAAKEIETLLSQLKARNAENAKLRQLLKTVAKSGMVGVPTIPAGTLESLMTSPQKAEPTGSKSSAASPSTKPGAPDGPSQSSGVAASGSSVSLASGAAPDQVDWTVALHNEDDVEVSAKLHRLATENSYLNKRCSELVLKVAELNDTNRSLQETLKEKLLAEPKSSMEHHLRDELATLKNELLKEQRRCLALEDQLRRTSRTGYSN